MVKHKLTGRTTLKELFHLIQGIEARAVDPQRKYGTSHGHAVHHPLLNQIRDMYSNHAFEQMLYQSMQSHDMIVVRKRKECTIYERQVMTVELGTTIYTVFDSAQSTSGKNNQVIITTDDNNMLVVSCNCRFFNSFSMFCSHTFAVFQVL